MEDPVKPDDSDEKWEEYPGHTRAKHELFSYYLDIWFRKLGNSNQKMRVFDCFAGRGEYYGLDDNTPLELSNISTQAEFPGSPQLILDVAVERSDLVGETECIFIEKKSKNAEILRSNLPNKNSLPENIDYDIKVGEFQTETPNLVSKTGGWRDPCFFFMDPFGYSPLEYDVVTRLASKDKFEILVNLMASEVIRWEDADKHHSALENLFGTEDWHSELEKHETEYWNDKEVSYYCHRLRQSGPKHTLAYLVTEENTKRMKYYLVFGTNSEHGVDKMHESMNNCGTGEYAYAPKRPGMDSEQRGLGTFTEEQRIEKLKKTLLEDFDDRSITFNELVLEYVTDNEYPPHQRKDIRKAAKRLEKEGLVSVNRVHSSTNRGLGKTDVLQFST